MDPQCYSDGASIMKIAFQNDGPKDCMPRGVVQETVFVIEYCFCYLKNNLAKKLSKLHKEESDKEVEADVRSDRFGQ